MGVLETSPKYNKLIVHSSVNNLAYLFFDTSLVLLINSNYEKFIVSSHLTLTDILHNLGITEFELIVYSHLLQTMCHPYFHFFIAGGRICISTLHPVQRLFYRNLVSDERITYTVTTIMLQTKKIYISIVFFRIV